MGIHHETLAEQFSKLYEDVELKFLRFDNDKIVAKDLEIDRVIALDLNGFDNRKNNIADFTTIENFKKSNQDLKVFEDKGFYLKNYSEFLIEVTPTDSEFLTGEVVFEINGYKIRIGHPSSLFQLLFGYMSRDKYQDGWNYFNTISVQGASINQIENTVESSIFLFANNTDISLYGYPKVYKFVSYDDRVIDYLEPSYPTKSRNSYNVEFYQEALALYNIGKRNNDPISFYRVLEYFFLINHKSKIIELIEKYNIHKEETKIIKGIRDIYTNSEEALLTYLLDSLSIKEVINEAYFLSLISKNDKRTFCKELYSFRNSIVHSKEESKFDIIIPVSIIDDEIDYWTKILDKLALRAIKKFCFRREDV